MTKADLSSKIYYPPVVSVVGHVDHGKTTLLDAVRKSDIAASESGGITQRIGASQIEVIHENVKRLITFIDTPGHEAFSNMRSYGVSASDIALLVVAADDGVMPQTRESITLLKKVQLPFIVVITKKDSPGANIEKVKQQLLSEEVLLEGLGGDVPYIAVSAKANDGISDLLDLILLSYDLLQINKDAASQFLGVVIESKRDKQKGIMTSLVIKSGTLSSSSKLYLQEKEIGKVRALTNTHGQNVKEVFPGDAVAVLGLTEILPTGSILYTTPQQKLLSVEKKSSAGLMNPQNIAEFFGGKEEKVAIILKAETSAESEAIKNALPSQIQVIFEGQGDIVFSDVLLAKETRALVVGFNVKIASDAKKFAEDENIFYRIYSIIYELLDEVADVVALTEERQKPRILGKAIIQAIFGEGERRVAGLKVVEGRIRSGEKVSLVRNDAVVSTATIASLKRGKQDVKEVGKNNECGVLLSPLVDFLVGDAIIAYSK